MADSFKRLPGETHTVAGMSPFSSRPSLNDDVVDAVMAAARTRATELGGCFTIAVMDDGATLRALVRMDSADLVTVGLAMGKARTAVANGMPSGIWRGLVANDAYLGLTIPLAFDRILEGAVLFGGGYPFQVDGTTVGSIGVSGGTEAEDEEVARTGLAAAPEAQQFADEQAL